MTLLITIAIPTYNNRKTVGRAVESALAQSDLDGVEVLVVDNASDDGSSELLRRIDSNQLRIERNDAVVPIWHNHNICLEKAKGKYVLFCHSDDELDIDAVKVIRAGLKSRNYPSHYIAWGHSLFRDFSTALSASGFRPGELFAGLPATRPFLSGGLTPSGTLYSQDFLDIGGFFETDNGLAPSDSTSLIWAALNGFRFEMLQELVFRRSSASTYVVGLSRKKIRQAIRDAWAPLLAKLSDEQLSLLLGQSTLRKSISPEFYRAVSSRLPSLTARSMGISGLKHPMNFVRVRFLTVMSRAILASVGTGRA